MDFVAIDVETANTDLGSICQVGIAYFRDGSLADTWMSLVDPKDDFDAMNVSIHGIDEYRVKGSPTWTDVFPDVTSRLRDRIVVSHTAFDRISIARACDRANLSIFHCIWLDSAKVVRRAWPEFSRSGYGLSNVAAHFRIDYQAHDALEDARCAGELLLRAVAHTGLTIDQWITHVEQPINRTSSTRYRKGGNPDGPLFGETIVFTGELSMSRIEAADLASAAGCRVEEGVTKRTTILVVGDHDARKLNGRAESAKQLKAKRLIGQGQAIRILSKSDFNRVILQPAGCRNPAKGQLG